MDEEAESQQPGSVNLLASFPGPRHFRLKSRRPGNEAINLHPVTMLCFTLHVCELHALSPFQIAVPLVLQN